MSIATPHYHRLCFEQAGGFNPELRFAEDLDLVLRMLAIGINYASIPKVLIKIHIHEHSSLSRSIDPLTKLESLQLFLFNHDKFLHQQLPLWLYYYTKLCGDYYRLGQKRFARKLVVSIFKKRWYHPKIWEVFLKFELRSTKARLFKAFTHFQ